MAWTLNSIRIYAQEFDEINKNIIARLQPLSGGTVLHRFGYESTVYTLNGVIVGTVDKDALLSLAKSSSTYTLVTPYATIATVSINTAKVNQRLSVISQSMRGDLDCNAPVYDIALELYIED